MRILSVGLTTKFTIVCGPKTKTEIFEMFGKKIGKDAFETIAVKNKKKLDKHKVTMQ